jgi:type II secretory ATPase GspE/PulE/Tfp pilus assembly ATPase PilB-like protein
MAGTLAVGDIIYGRGYELHISAKGIALTSNGVVGPDSDRQFAGYDEIESVQAGTGGRGLVIFFAGERLPWTIPGVLPREAEWAQGIIDRAARRARMRGTAEFSGRRTVSEVAQLLDQWLLTPAADPSMIADFILLQATLNGATDVHLRPEDGGAAVRFRIDGQLVEAGRIPGDMSLRVAARIKALAGMRTYQRNCAQTGRLLAPVEGREVDVRVTTLPTTHGEKLTARIFDPLAALVDLNSLGMEPAALDEYRRAIGRPNGCVLLTGPAGSGKTTTMYSSLRWIVGRTSRRSICTVEEPVELELAGIDQTDVNRDAGLDFAAGLRIVLRQDPQVIMVGEIRDPETAEIAVRAGLTGHLVFSTVHAASTAGVFARLMEMGLEPYLVASSVTAVMAQRLVRRVCEDCATDYQPPEHELREAGLSSADVTGWQFRHGGGCPQCGDSGYRGRTGVFELLPVTADLRAAVMDRRPVQEIEALAAAGRPRLWQAGLKKVQEGVTTLPEVMSALGGPEG